MHPSCFHQTKSTPFQTAHVREYDLLKFNAHPEWLIRPTEEERLYARLKGLKVSETLQPKAAESTSKTPADSSSKKIIPQLDEPSLMWPGYKLKARNLRYETTSQATYGRFLPTVYEMPDSNHGLSQTFSSFQMERGMDDRNWSMNNHVTQ